jgi:hypothetical protein
MTKILDSAAELDLFARDFNMGHPLCDFVDAGNGKECADAKLKGNINSVRRLQDAVIGERQYLTPHLSMVQPRHGRRSVQGSRIRRIR